MYSEIAIGQNLSLTTQVDSGPEKPLAIRKRTTLINSPELFPHLSLEVSIFLEQVANMAHSLRKNLLSSPTLKPHIWNSLFDATSSVVGITEMLVRRPETDLPNLGKNGSQSDYSLNKVVAKEVSVYGKGGNLQQSIEGMEMSFSRKGKTPLDTQDILVSIQPDTVRQTIVDDRPVSFLDGADQNLVRNTIAFNRSAEEAALATLGYREIRPFFIINSDGADLEIVFRESTADCKLLARIDNEDAIVALGSVPLATFRDPQESTLSSEEAVKLWLRRIVSDMERRVSNRNKTKIFTRSVVFF